MYNRTALLKDPKHKEAARFFLESIQLYYQSTTAWATPEIAKGLSDNIASWSNLTQTDINMIMNQTQKGSVLNYTSALAHTKEATILSAADRGAGYTNIFDMFHPTLTDMGYCFAYNNPDHKVVESGVAGGVALHLDVHSEEYTFNELDPANERFKVHFHAPGDKPQMRNHGTALVAGYSYFIGIKKTQKIYSTHDGCVATDPSQIGQGRMLKYYDKYSRNNCFRECESNYTSIRCGCRQFHQPGDVPLCPLASLPACMMHSNNFPREGRNACDCPVACVEPEYETKVSALVYPSTYQANLLKWLGQKEDSWKRHLYVYIYMESMEVTTVEQVVAYTFREVWGDLGGCLGLCLGASIITIVEVLDFVVRSGVLLFTRRG